MGPASCLRTELLVEGSDALHFGEERLEHVRAGRRLDVLYRSCPHLRGEPARPGDKVGSAREPLRVWAGDIRTFSSGVSVCEFIRLELIIFEAVWPGGYQCSQRLRSAAFGRKVCQNGNAVL